MYHPKKETPAQMEFVLLPDMDTNADRNAEMFKGLEKVDVICYLARVFENDTVFHVEGSVNAKRDIQNFWDELLLSDHIFVEKRLERIAKEHRQKDAQRAAAELDLMTRMQAHLEAGKPLFQLQVSVDDRKLISSYPFLTFKPLIAILNVGEAQIGDESLVADIAANFGNQGFEWIAISAQIEQEISLLDDAERIAFLAELGITHPALDRLTLLCYETLGLISYFTVGEDEVRAWTIRKGALAPQAGGVIHGDIERGFIRAEVMHYNDLISLGDEQKVKAAGKLVQKGRDAEMVDGDIVHFLFKV
jgi:GTP-binding protein YchF